MMTNKPLFPMADTPDVELEHVTGHSKLSLAASLADKAMAPASPRFA
jgi:hypothetical protein